jgi:glutamine amidotransferase
MDILGVSSVVTADPHLIGSAEKIILPGVGHFGKAMENLRRLDLIDTLNRTVLSERKPILGICLGMELMTEKSEEGNAAGLGWFPAEIVKFRVSEKPGFKIPHMGWNRVRIKKQSALMSNIPETAEFYFVHSYHLKVRDESDVLNETEYEASFPSAIERDNIFGVQYHPEKSHDAGLRLLENFVGM